MNGYYTQQELTNLKAEVKKLKEEFAQLRKEVEILRQPKNKNPKPSSFYSSPDDIIN